MTMADNLAEQAASEEAARKRRTRRVVVASVAGNAMEWYDFFIYGTAAALVFGELFFPRAPTRCWAPWAPSPASRWASWRGHWAA